MLNIIKSDLYRILHGKAIYIAVIAMLAMVVISLFEMSAGSIGITITTSNMETIVADDEITEELSNTNSILETRKIMKEHGNFELDKEIIGANANLYYVFIVVVAIVLTTDLSHKTAKNSLSSAISRKTYYFSKLVLCLIICTVLILINNYGTYLLNIIMNGENFSSSLLEITKLTFMQLPLLYGLVSLLVCIGFITKKMATYNGITIPFIMVSQLILYGLIAICGLDTNIMTYEIQNALGNLAINPETEFILKCVLLGIAYVIGFNLLGYYSFRKTEIK